MQNNIESKIKKIKQLEAIFWLFLLLIIIACFSFSSIYNKKRVDDYTIFMQDIDGLIVGSPVRMMGIEIGYITKIKPTNNEVFVNFIITKKDVTLPQGCKVGVEFSGMAGSKSLEIYPPEKDDIITTSTPLIQTLPPRRLHDALGLLSDMLDKISTIIYTTSFFGSKVQDINYSQNDKQELLNLIDTSENLIKKVTK